MKLSRGISLLLAGLSILVVGCKSGSFTPYVAPRVTGVVLHSETGAALPGVRVSRNTGDATRGGLEQPKGGQMLRQPPTVLTDEKGAFALASTRALSLFPRSGWMASGITLNKAGFEKQTLLFTLKDATNNPIGEPLIDTGSIRLVPSSQEKRKTAAHEP